MPVASAVAGNSKISRFAENVIYHVVAHEFGHALLRELTLPILGNEENIADSFAVIAIHQSKPERVQEIILDRARSYRLEAEQDGLAFEMLAGEHEHDFRRAFWSFCILYGLESDKTEVPDWVEMSDNDRKNCRDIAQDISRSWREMLATKTSWKATGANNVELIFGEGPFKSDMMNTGILQEITQIANHVVWPNNITLHFDHCSDGASWSRSERRILVCDSYLERFIGYAEEAQKRFP